MPAHDAESTASEVDWPGVFFDVIDRLKRRSERRFVDQNLADEAFNHALETLSADGWRRLADFRGDASPRTYLTTLFNSLLEDFSRTRFGRKRPPAWLVRLGEMSVQVYTLLCLQRLDPESIVDQLCARGRYEAQRIRRTINLVRSRIPSCGEHTGEVPLTAVHEVADPATPDDLAAEDSAVDALVAAAWLLRDPADSDEPSPRRRAGAAMLARALGKRAPELRAALQLTDDERLVLRLVYQEGLKIAAVARHLEQPEHRVRRDLDRVRARIRQAFASSGLTRDTLAALFDGPDRQ